MDEALTLGEQVDYIAKKVTVGLNIRRSVQGSVERQTLLTVYQSIESRAPLPTN